MISLKAEIISAIELTGIPVIEISPTMMEPVRQMSREIFGKDSVDIVDHIDHSGMRDPEAWRWLPQHLQHVPVIMYFEEIEEEAGYLFEDGSQVTHILGNCYSFQFWLINLGYDYQIRFRDDDIVVGKGEVLPILSFPCRRSRSL